MARKRTNIMLCYPMDFRRLQEKKFGWTWPVIGQPKLDGNRLRIIIDKIRNRSFIYSSTGRVIHSLPHINKAILEATKNFPNELIELDGEGYHHGMYIEEITSIISCNNPAPNHERIEFHLFDIINDEPQLDRFGKTFLINDNDYVKRVVARILYNENEVLEFYHEMLDAGYEGIVLRDMSGTYLRAGKTERRSTKIMKFKPKKTDVYTISNIFEAMSETGKPLNMAGAFECRDFEGEKFKVAAGRLDHEQRRMAWKNRIELIGKEIIVEYQTTTKYKVPRFGLAVTIPYLK